MKPYLIDWPTLRDDLMLAYLDARKHKRNRRYQLEFESNLDNNLDRLCDELYYRTYKPLPSECFIITDPKKREVFAAAFRDRIVHHLYYNYVHQMFERTFINDSYSCIKGRGTHYGIKRLGHHIRCESQNYTESCFVLNMDIRGYFMHIDREQLLKISLESLERMSNHKIGRYRKEIWCEKVDMDLVSYLTREIVLLDCTVDCIIIGDRSDWDDLPDSKSLFKSPRGKGLPIGNLTSQLFSNVYLNVLDQYMKRILGCRHYGRYVDDFYVVSADKEWLHSLIPKVRQFLSETLGLELHEGKLRIDNIRLGVEFLGAYLKPWRNYVSNNTLNRMKQKIKRLAALAHEYLVQSAIKNMMSFALKLRASLNSFCGVLCHYRSYRLRCKLWNSTAYHPIFEYGRFNKTLSLFIPVISSRFAIYVI